MVQPQTEAQKRTMKQSRFTLKQQKYIFIYGCLLVPIIFFISIRFFPMLYTFSLGFFEWSLLSEQRPFVGFNNYTRLLNDELFHISMLNTFKYVVVGMCFQLTLGLMIALLLQKINHFRGYFRVVYFIPYVTSIVAISWVFKWIFMNNGIVNDILVRFGFQPQLFLHSPDQAIYVIIGTMVWQFIGFQVVIFLAGLENIPDMFYEAAEIDGANAWQRFWKVTLPLLNPAIVFSAVIGSINFLQTFTQVVNMSPDYQGGPLNSTVTMVLYIYRMAFQRYDIGYASAATVVLFLIILALTLLQMKVLTKKFDY
jgi:multiple sugar transport system permease protein